MALALCVCLSTQSLAAFSGDLPDGVLVRNRWVDLTVADYESALAQLPDKVRPNVSMSPRRVELLLNRLLIDKTLAAQARARGADAKQGSGESESLAAVELRQLETDAGVAFDAKKASYLAKAEEVYTLERERFREPAQVRLSDIAIALKGRTSDEALDIAKKAHARVVAGEDFAKVAREMSDDPVTRDKGGALPLIAAKDLEPTYAAAVFALSRPGEISEPIKARAAYHVVRLEELRPAEIPPFDQVRDRIIDELRNKYIAEQREARLRSIYADPNLEVNQAAVDALVKHEDPKLFKPPVIDKSPDAAQPASSLPSPASHG
ncbi:MAG TPA: peptidylprolyl isomerase [Casimicrobiaceae bacterium]|nr:peptidylprolyl isomerase [Casimicrobiaceae bacterium]